MMFVKKSLVILLACCFVLAVSAQEAENADVTVEPTAADIVEVPEPESSEEIPEEKPAPVDEPEPKPEEEGDIPVIPAWSYDGEYAPDRWGEFYNSCRSDILSQSPVDIQTQQTIFTDKLGAISFEEKINKLHKNSVLRNTGHSVNLIIPYEAYVQGGGLPSPFYRVAGITFRWSNDDLLGSDHAINGKYSPLEMQIVTFDSEEYATADDAVERDMGALAVISVLFKLSEEDNPEIQPIVGNLKYVSSPDTERYIKLMRVNNLLPSDTMRYYQYEGSLSVPPCMSDVKWDVFSDQLTISPAQLKEFRNLKGTTQDGSTGVAPITHNGRPVQPIGDRVTYRSFLFRSEISHPQVVESQDNGAGQLTGDSPLVMLMVIAWNIKKFVFADS